MGLEIYGGNPEVVASFEEMQRVAAQLELAADRLQDSMFESHSLLFDLIPNPIPQLQLGFMLPGLIERIRALSWKTKLAAEGYFSTEARIILLMQQTLLPIAIAKDLVSHPNPISQASAEVFTKTAAAFAVLGLTGRPSLAKSVLISTAGQLTANAVGYGSMPQFVATAHSTQQALGFPPDARGSAVLTKIEQTKTVGSMAEHAERLRSTYAQSATIRIEVYQHGYGRQLVVYVPGTQSFSLSGPNPLNIRSNLTAISGGIAPSQQAVESALEQLEAGERDRVLFVGHSQGALISGNIAQRPQPYEVSGLISFGGPISHLDLKIPTIAISHQADPVSVLGGGVNPMRENWVTVSGKGEFSSLVQAHRMSSYEETSSELDQSSDPGFRRVQEQLWQDPDRSGLQYSFEIRRN